MHDLLFNWECYNLFLFKVFSHSFYIFRALLFSLFQAWFPVLENCFMSLEILRFLFTVKQEASKGWWEAPVYVQGFFEWWGSGQLSASGVPFSGAVQFFKEYPSLLHDYQPSGSKVDKDSLGEEKGWIPDIQCVEFSLLLLFLASHLKLIAGCPGSAERLFHFSRENSLSVLSASTLASPWICFNLELERSC